MEVFVLAVLLVVGFAFYYVLSPSKKRIREEKRKEDEIHNKSILWKSHYLFSEIFCSCTSAIDDKITWAKQERMRQNQSIRGDTDAIVWDVYNNSLKMGLRLLFRFDNNEYEDLTREQSDALVEAIYQELQIFYRADQRLKLRLQKGPNLYGYSIFVDVSEYHPKKVLKAIDI